MVLSVDMFSLLMLFPLIWNIIVSGGDYPILEIRLSLDFLLLGGVLNVSIVSNEELHSVEASFQQPLSEY